jgi:hypothetical protein
VITIQSSGGVVHYLTSEEHLKEINTTSKQINAIGHFYYYLNISFLMAKKSAQVKSQTGVNMYIYRWAISEKQRKLFPPSAEKEIDWLISVGQKSIYSGRLDLVVSNILRHLDI